MLTTTDGNRLDGCIFNSGSVNDSRMDFATDAHPPRKVDLRQWCTPVEDQGRIGSCTANAAVGALEYLYNRRDGQCKDLSRLFVYFNTRRLRGDVQQDNGAQINEAMAAVLAFGACESNLWPYDTSRFIEQPPEQAYLNGRNYEAINYARVAGPAGCIPALAAGIPVVYGTFMPQRCYQEAGSTGLVPKTTPEERSNPLSGGHCMLIVGYDLDTERFLVRNSWGTSWGAQGYVEIPFEEMALWSPPDTFWCAVEMEKTNTQSYALVAPMKNSDQDLLGTTASDLRSRISSQVTSGLEIGKRNAAQSGQRISDSLSQEKKSAATTARETGVVSCNPCAGSGQCYNCKGSGSVLGAMCMSCRGAGKCDICNGQGSAARNFGNTSCFVCSAGGLCYVCEGSGVLFGKECNTCHGNRRCRVCSGVGYT